MGEFNVDKTTGSLEQTAGMKANAVTMTKLWENNSPSSSFASQNVTLSSSDYDLLMIIYNWTASTQYSLSNIIQKNHAFVLCAALPSASGARNVSRYGSFNSATEIHFDPGSDAVGTTASSTNNDRCIPITIYGIKIVS